MNKWEKEVAQSLLDSEESALKELEKQYRSALNEINQRIKMFQVDIDLLDEAMNTEGMTDIAKNALLSQKRSKIYQKQFQEALQGQISGILDNMQGKNYSTINNYLKESYEDAYIGTLYDLNQQGIPIVTPIDQASVTKAILTDSKVSNGLYNALGVDVSKLKKSISQEISRGIASALSYTEIARNIANASKAPMHRAMTITRTEGHRIQQTATDNASQDAKDHGADLVKIWDATLDGLTRPSHRMVDGEVRELDEKFSNGLMFPGDPAGSAGEVINCRCARINKPRWAVESGIAKMDNFTGELLTFDSPKDYAEYKKRYWADENQKYMEYVQDLEGKYGTKKFETILENMSFNEFQQLKKLEDANTMWKMAASTSENDWSKTVSRAVTKQERTEIIQYAKDNDVKIGNIKYFDGDTELLKAEIDTISKMQTEFPIKKKVILNVAYMSDDDFGSTQQQTITINVKALRDRAITEANILAGNKFASSTVEDIVVHEYGHAFASINGNVGLEIAKQAYYNLYKIELSNEDVAQYLLKNVSLYSVSTRNLSEIIPEVLAKNNSNADEFTKEFAELLKKV